jgi:hypothetical protein
VSMRGRYESIARDGQMHGAMAARDERQSSRRCVKHTATIAEVFEIGWVYYSVLDNM